MSITFSLVRKIENGWALTAHSLDLNVSNSNFTALMDLLGYDDPDYCGTIEDLQNLRSRIDFVLDSIRALPALDEGKPVEHYGGRKGVTIIDCGRADGYFAHRLSELRELVELAEKSSVAIGWA